MPRRGLIGPLETGFPAKVAATLLDAPPVPAAHAALLGATLRQRAPDLAAAIPAPQGPTRTIEVPPVPHLRLFGMDLPGTVISYMRGYSGYTVPHRAGRAGAALLPLRLDPRRRQRRPPAL